MIILGAKDRIMVCPRPNKDDPIDTWYLLYFEMVRDIVEEQIWGDAIAR